MDRILLGNVKGPQGDEGISAYGLAVRNGFSGTEAEWLESLKGDPGTPGKPGPAGSYDILASSEDVRKNESAGKIVDALVIKEVFQSVSDGKELLASAITGKGIPTDAGETFQGMAEKISTIIIGGNGSSHGAISLCMYENEALRVDQQCVIKTKEDITVLPMEG